jgi:hypothetical protein
MTSCMCAVHPSASLVSKLAWPETCAHSSCKYTEFTFSCRACCLQVNSIVKWNWNYICKNTLHSTFRKYIRHSHAYAISSSAVLSRRRATTINVQGADHIMYMISVMCFFLAESCPVLHTLLLIRPHTLFEPTRVGGGSGRRSSRCRECLDWHRRCIHRHQI